jgi:hypothetical protein
VPTTDAACAPYQEAGWRGRTPPGQECRCYLAVAEVFGVGVGVAEIVVD